MKLIDLRTLSIERFRRFGRVPARLRAIAHVSLKCPQFSTIQLEITKILHCRIVLISIHDVAKG